MGIRIILDDDKPNNDLEWAPPLKIISVVTLFAATLDLLADFLVCLRVAEFLDNFHSRKAVYAAYGYFFFTGVSIIVYVFEMIDICQSLKYEKENIFTSRLAKSMVLALEEVPMPTLLNILFTNEPRLSLANPIFFASWIKLVALSWGIIKFTKLRFFWPCLPCNPKHNLRENIRRMFTFTAYRCAMIFVNICHIYCIIIVSKNIIASANGGKPIDVKSDSE